MKNQQTVLTADNIVFHYEQEENIVIGTPGYMGGKGGSRVNKNTVHIMKII